jgi:hypothetical protein
MSTECIQTKLDLGRSGARKLVGAFDGGAITSNGGVALLAGADGKLRLAERLAACFTDHRMTEVIKHTLPDLLRQRIFGLALGYEDLIDHDALRFDPALATDDPLYGDQEGRHFHGYYDCYCYLPLYIFCGRHLLAAKLRSSANDAADGAVQEVARIVDHIRQQWPSTTIVIRADSGFCRDDLMAWCEENGVQYVLGLAGNERLAVQIAPEMKLAKRKAKRTGRPARVFADFSYRTRKSWSAERRVIGKAEFTNGGANPRFIVTNVHAAFGSPRFLYETVYCQRGEMENRLKECQGDLFADRTPTPTMRANQLRLWLSSLAYVLMCAVRRIGLAGTELERATCGTIRLVLLKLGARVTISVRRVKLAFASSFPKADVFARAARRLCT